MSPARSLLVPLTRDVPAPYTEAGAARRGQDRLTVAFRPGNQAGPAVSQTRCRGRLRPREADRRGRREPKLTARLERLASGPALTSSAAHGRGPAPEEDGAQSRSLRALAPHARSAPFAAVYDRGCGRVRSRFGGRRPAPPRLLGNIQASPQPPLGRLPQHTFLLPFRQRTPEGDQATTSISRYPRRLGGKGRAAVTVRAGSKHQESQPVCLPQKPRKSELDGMVFVHFREDQHNNVGLLVTVPFLLSPPSLTEAS